MVHSAPDGRSIPTCDGGKTALERATERLRDADIALSAARSAKADAVRAVEAQYAPVIAERQRAFAEAVAAKQKAENEVVSPHEWDGRKVWREEIQYAQFVQKVIGRHRIEGVVETYRHGTDLGPGYKRLAPGDGYVRLLKKDGSLGKKTEEFWRFSGERAWRLADDSKALGTEA